MNKPEYFVENQLGGPNKHEKLSPAMSLLLIVGHVKDGMELAREFGLPRPLHHFIESHHGTTLVEFFYHRARQQALKDSTRQHEEHEGELDDTHVPEEFEYRYPGPRPQTREAAILMLSDGIESATRTLAEPTPARIEALVRAMANKRLMDGQFEECDITLKDLNLIVDSISRTLTSIYHGRVVYPGARSESRVEKSA
jgi:membrane-associated HD superfamily phosphohydrolase